VKKLREATGAAIVCGVLRLRSASPLCAQDDSEKKSQILRMTRL
jgi:hypothetical protein